MPRIFDVANTVTLFFAMLLAGACSSPEPSIRPVRLVDVFASASVEGTPASERDDVYPRSEWLFEEGVDQTHWQASAGVTDLAIVDGVLTGRTSSNLPALATARTQAVPDSELLHAVELRMRVSAGSRVTLRFARGPELDVRRVLINAIGAATTPILPGEEMRTYTLRPTRAYRAAEIDHVVLTPTDVANAEFAIDSLRLVFRSEHLRSIPSGIGWHGVSEIYRESIVARAPETVRFEVELPARPALDLAVATIEPGTVTFRVDVAPADGSEPTTIRETVTEPNAWRSLWVDLDESLRGPAEVALSLESETEGALGFWGAPAIRSRELPENQPQGVVLIITDTLRADHLSLYGYDRDTAPTLSRIAREGAWFSDVISQSTWTKVSVPSIQTSLYPTTHTVEDIPDRLPAAATTIAEVYRDAGYATLGLATIPFVGQLTNLHQGYETFYEFGSVPFTETPPSHIHAERLLSWLEQHRDSRFFALYHVSDPHGPFRPKPAYETAFAEPGDMDRLDELIAQVRPHIRNPMYQLQAATRTEELESAGIDPEEFVRYEKLGYDGEIRGMDDAIGKLIDGLDRYGLTERTLVAVVSDHGTGFLEHGTHAHGNNVYGELNRVPMILWGPGRVPASRTVDRTVQTIDLMPTLLELSGLPVPERAQGESLVPSLMDEETRAANRPAITELPPKAVGPELPNMTALIYEGWKIIQFDEEGGLRYELYDHIADPLSLRDVSNENPEIVARLAEQVERFRSFATEARLGDAAAREGLDAEELERLRSLGYIQ